MLGLKLVLEAHTCGVAYSQLAFSSDYVHHAQEVGAALHCASHKQLTTPDLQNHLHMCL